MHTGAHFAAGTDVTTALRVLIAEDSEEDALLLVRELRRGGYEPVYQRVDTASAMRAALEHQTWDLVIGDHSIPGFSGLEALALTFRRAPRRYARAWNAEVAM